MPNSCTLSSESSPSRILPWWRTLNLISLIGGLAGLMSILAACSPTTVSNNPTPTLTSLSFSDNEVKDYARVVLAIEPIRQSAYKEIQRTTKSGKVPFIVCNQPNSMASLPIDDQNIAVNYCSQAKKIGESNGLTMPRFNAMTTNAQSNPILEKRIQNEIITLRR